ncbi:MAG: FAD-dependent oxidoreductase [Solirubrobacterales bacterium]
MATGRRSRAPPCGCARSRSAIETDLDGRTGVQGVYAAGDCATDHSRSVANAVGFGSRAAYAVSLDLVAA